MTPLKIYEATKNVVYSVYNPHDSEPKNKQIP